MSGWGEIFDMASYILLNSDKSDADFVKKVFLVSRYEDDKIIIEGKWPLNYQAAAMQERVFSDLWIALKLKPSDSGQSQPFPPIMRSVKDTTLVFREKRGVIYYYRQGHWIMYIQKLANQTRSGPTEENELNNQPVDDAHLFKDGV
jgi:hypothetical protein